MYFHGSTKVHSLKQGIRHEQPDYLSLDVHREETEREANTLESPYIFFFCQIRTLSITWE